MRPTHADMRGLPSLTLTGTNMYVLRIEHAIRDFETLEKGV